MQYDQLKQILSPEFQQFLYENEDADIPRLLLSGGSVNVKQAADQILSRRKAKDKLPDWYKAENIAFPPPLSIEQSSSQVTADYKKKLLSGDLLVDLTGGMGVDCLALSKNFEQITYVEKDQWLCTLFSHNQKLLTEKDIKVENTAAEDYLQNFTGKATFFIDPARRDAGKNRVFRFEDCSPDLNKLLPLFKERAEKVLVKAAPLIDLSQGISQLQHVKEVHVLSIKNEVKEVLFLLDFSYDQQPVIHCVNLLQEHSKFSFTLSEEKATRLIHSDVKRYLYDPNSSILKAGAFKSIAVHFPVQKLSPNTHLYTSDNLLADFPGRKFEIINPHLKKKSLNKFLPEGKANVLSKNYPIKTAELKKKLNIRDGGDFFVIGFRDSNEHSRVILAKVIS